MDLKQKKMNFFTQLFKSIFDFNSYKYFVKLKTSQSMAYLLLITLIFGTLSVIKPIYGFNMNVQEIDDVFKNKVSDFTFQNGKLNVHGEMPVIAKEKHNVIIIDTSGHTDRSIVDGYKTAVFISKDAIVKKDNNEYIDVDFDKLPQGINFSKSDIKDLILPIKWINVFMILGGLIVYFFGKIISALMISFAATIITAVKNVELSFDKLFKLSIYALTLPSILKIVVEVSGKYISFFTFVYYTIAFIYVGKAISLIKEENQSITQ